MEMLNLRQILRVKDFVKQKIGILGGGQLGKMLCQAGSRWGLDMYILDADPNFPAGQINPKFTTGDFGDADTVYQFGKDKDVVTIEIEHVSIEGLEKLEASGVQVYPDSKSLKIIKDKGLQKLFYKHYHLNTAPFRLYASKEEIMVAINEGREKYPFVQKSRTAGYDGKGVAIIRKPEDLSKLMDTPSVVEDLIPMKREIAVIVTRSIDGDVVAFPAVEMAFHEEANLVEMLLCPVAWSVEDEEKAANFACEIAEKFGTVGLLAVEMFQLEDGRMMVNEVAPRPHNSGHHTIECCNTSQYEQHLRAITGLPLGSTLLNRAGAMVNLLGEPGYSGPVKYLGWENCLKNPDVHIHLYGKSETRPFRKMGHATITAETVEDARNTATWVQQNLKVIA